ncbi:MAG: hypothetical protein LBM06_05775 [Prevotellaceae bacterium]|jgi:hypothetical protein|nr:hypothetical protein [Prevotellaceae bacterium]
MKENVLILSKTQMENGVCVGGLTDGGRYVRLLDNGGSNQPKDTSLAPLQIWEIDYVAKANTRPPHVEDVVVQTMIRKGSLNRDANIEEFLKVRNVPIWRGTPDMLFDGLVQWTLKGSGYIDAVGGVPNHSVGFWISDKPLYKTEYEGSIRYKYRFDIFDINGRSIKYKGFEDPVSQIPAGTLIRVSLARWWISPSDNSEKCWLQLSGWYNL